VLFVVAILISNIWLLQGMQLSRDTAGNVYLTRLTESAVTVRGVREKNNDVCLADDIIKSNGVIGKDKIKVELQILMIN